MRYFLLVLLSLSPLLFASGIENAQGAPSPILLELLEKAHISHNNNWDSIIQETQKKLRHSQGELWSPKSSNSLPFNTAFNLFSRLGMFQPVVPLKKEYNTVFINGSSVSVVRERLLFLRRLWEHGVRFHQIVALCGQRPLNHLYESKEVLLTSPGFPIREDWEKPLKMPQHEGEMIQFVYDQMDLPKQLKQLPFSICCALRQPRHHRPSHKDALSLWLENNHISKDASYLFISSQPFIDLQRATEKNILPESTSFETVGEGITWEMFASTKTAPEICLHVLFKRLYEEKAVPLYKES